MGLWIGGQAQRFLISGPGWGGEVPQGMTHIEVPTRYMVILGRTYADGTEADYNDGNHLGAFSDVGPDYQHQGYAWSIDSASGGTSYR